MLTRTYNFALLFALALGLTTLIPGAARADWYEASSDNFVIYADDSEKDIRRYAENLERYHKAMEQLLGYRVEKPSPSNRVTIFSVGSGRQLRKVAGKGSRNIASFYIPRAGASRAFVQDIKSKDGYPHFSTIVLLHEYAHHFLIASSRFEMPRWMSEGGAEFFAAATFKKDGGVLIGRVARHRAPEMSYVRKFRLQELLASTARDRRKERPTDAFYGRSWVLYHYLTFNPDRRDQLVTYSKAIRSGQSSIDAAESAFGDLDTLERELMQYIRGRNFKMLELQAKDMPIGKVTLRRLPEGESNVMPLRIRSQRGVNSEQAAEILEDVRELAARYPADAGVLAALAEAEYDAGNDDEAIAAADRAIAIDPTRTNPYVQKGFALFRKAKDSPVPDQAYDAAMKPFTKLNQIENDHPLPLIYYYRSYTQRGIAPPENARHALERAAQLAPFDKGLWFNVATMWMQEGKVALAKSALQPIANDPHGGSRATGGKKLIAILDKLPEGEPIDIRKAMRMSVSEKDTAETDGEDAAKAEARSEAGSESAAENGSEGNGATGAEATR